jgi:hypothetical protein
MKNLFLLMTAALMLFGGCKKEGKDGDEPAATEAAIPPYAASTHTQVFGAQTWSDAIHDPACNKPDFDGGTTDTPKADGRSYTDGENTYYYYSWPYVNEHAERLCPSPWRVPSYADFAELVKFTDAAALSAAWDYGGYTIGSSTTNTASLALYWSSTENGSGFAYYPYYHNSYLSVYYNSKNLGFQVRCVK